MICANCEALRDKVRRLERELGLRMRDGEIGAIMAAFGVSPLQARLLMTLYRARGRIVSKEAIMESVGTETTGSLKSHIFQIRSRMGSGDVIETTDFHGYALATPGMSMVMAALEPLELQDVR